MDHFWPFQKPEAPGALLDFLRPVIDLFVAYTETVYRSGIVHGAFLASLCWIVALAVIGAVTLCVWFGKKRELAIGLVAIAVGVVLWYGSRLPGPKNTLPTTPNAIPQKPEPKRWRPFGDTQ